MYLKPRIIPCLLIEDDGLVKTIKFNKRTYIGDPINAVKIFNEEEADELCLLDISSHKKTSINFELLKDIASEAFMPLSYGGGIKCLDDVKKLYRIGFEKIIINSSLYTNPDLIREAVQFAGSQSVVASIDYKKNVFGKTECYIECGKKKIDKSVESLIRDAEELGVGEILLNSIDRDGMMNGYDFSTIKNASETTNLPIICCGGASSLADMRKAVVDCGAHAAAAGSFFVFFGPRRAVLINYPSEKEQKMAGLY